MSDDYRAERASAETAWTSTNPPSPEQMLARLWPRTRVEVRAFGTGLGACWIWQGGMTSAGGYGRVQFNGSTKTHLHRLAYQVFNGPIPRGLLVCHKCDQRACWRPGHLFVGTNVDNATDRDRKGRQRRKLSDAQVIGSPARPRKPVLSSRLTTARTLTPFSTPLLPHVKGRATRRNAAYWPTRRGLDTQGVEGFGGPALAEPAPMTTEDQRRK